MTDTDSIFDTVVVGGGFAGLTAAVWLRRHNRSVLVLSSGPSRNHRSHAIHGFPGYEGKEPSVLLADLLREAEDLGVTMAEAWVDGVSKQDATLFIVSAGGNTYQGRRLLLATGTEDAKPEIAGFEDYEGISAWHCPSCDGYEYRDKRLAIVSWGPQMAGYAREFTAFTDKITVLTLGHEPEADDASMEMLNQLDISVVRSNVTGIQGDGGKMTALLLDDGSSLPCDGLFYSIAHRPRLSLMEQLGCRFEQDGHATCVNRKQETNVPGVYVAGDVAPLEEFVVVAAAMGAVAAHNIHESLFED